jgi:uncharacterized protein
MPTVSTTNCPHCQGTQLRRSKWRSGEERLLGWFFSPYRCLSCKKRFFRLSHRFGSLAGGALLAALVIGVIGVVVYVVNLEPSEQATRQSAGLPPPSRSLAKGADSAPVPVDTPLSKRAAKGDAHAQFELGMQFLSGEGVPAKSPTQALKWLEMAAKQGHADARFNLGLLYRSGQGAVQNFETAFYWMELAAKQNHVEAQYSVGLMHKTGMSVPIDSVKAYMWVNLAASQGHVGAIVARDNLLQTMTPAQVSEGQRASREWTSAGSGGGDKRPDSDKAAAQAKAATGAEKK